MEITRNYAHRSFGAIGEVTFTAPDAPYVLNGTTLPESSVRHLLTFALQTLQDAYAGAGNADEAVGAFNTKLDRIVNGTIGVRMGGGGVDDFTATARRITRAAIKQAVGAKSEAWAAFTGLSDAEQNEKLDANYAKNEKQLKPIVEADIARKVAERAEKAALAGSFTL